MMGSVDFLGGCPAGSHLKLPKSSTDSAYFFTVSKLVSSSAYYSMHVPLDALFMCIMPQGIL